MADSLGKVLEAGGWQKVLFTTYSLSLTFFESIILRALRESECREIWVVADAEGYRSSLMERGSNGVGYEYRLIPIGLRNGVFHAKCCYLIGAEADVLIVGSGNLTFGGFGRNLEVLEILSSDLQPECFLAFADFLTGLKSRDDVVCPDFSWADSFAARARQVGTREVESNFPQYPKLLTSLERPLTEQLATEVLSCGEVESVTILSPFFDLDAGAVKDLATKTNAREVHIALPVGSEQSTFPFPKANRWPAKVSAVSLSGKQEKRKLHAKWIEWKTTTGTLTLTGSVNATRQALSGVNNIEVGVLRLAPVDKPWAVWKKARVPTTYLELTFTRSGMGSSHLVFAELLDNGDLRGRIISVSSPAGTWSGDIQRPNGDSIPVNVTVKDDGKFYDSHLTTDEDFLFASGLQIKLDSDGRIARGWITNLTILDLPKSHRISASSLLRLLSREETEEDDAALLEYFAVFALDHLKTFQSRVITKNASEEETNEEPELFSIDLESLRPDAHISEFHSLSHDPIISAGIAFERLFAQLRRRLLGHVSRRDRIVPAPVAGSGLSSEEPDAEEDNSQAGRSRQRFENAFDCFMASMDDLAKSTTLPDEHRRAVLVIWIEVGLHMLVRRKHDRAEANAFLRTWFWTATTLTSIREEADSLEQHILTSAAILIANGPASESMRVYLHEALEHYWKGAVNNERAIAGLLPQSPLSIAGLFLEESQSTLKEHLLHVLSSTTLRDELEKLLRGESLPEASPLLQSEAGRDLCDELQRPRQKQRIEFLKDSALCPSEFIRLSEACKGELQRSRVARCSVCGFLILRVAP